MNWPVAWTLDPGLILGLVVLLEAYVIGVGPLRRRYRLGPPVTKRQITWFALGYLVLVAALVSPLHALGEAYLFSAHMVQHVLITLVAPPLLLLGTPGWLLSPLLRIPLVRTLARSVTAPVFAFLVFNGAFALWHVPSFYDAALNQELLHTLEHGSFFGAAVLMWWPILSPMSELPRLPLPFQTFYLFLLSIPQKIIGALITFAGEVLYPTYEIAPRVAGLSALADQQLGGIIMWVPGGLIIFGVFTTLFFLWMGPSDPGPTLVVPAADTPGRRNGHANPDMLSTPPAPPAPTP